MSEYSVAVDVLARCLYLLERIRSGDNEHDAASEWDADELLSETYELFRTRATVAIHLELHLRAMKEATGDV